MKLFNAIFGKNKKNKRKDPIVGVALGSGGAKGFAILGAMYALEENGVDFDVYAGTSIGSILGAFFAAGYSVSDAMALLHNVDAGEIKNAVMLNMSTSGLFKVVDDNIGNLKIEELKKPFRAVATDLISGEEKVFDKGSVALAVCASSSMPPFFKPVSVEGKKYIDGAFVNSVPADVVRSLGADYVLGIDLSSHNKKPSVLSQIFPHFKGGVEKPWQKGYEYSDYVLRPDLVGYKSTDFKKGYEMFDIGYDCAIEALPEIKKGIAAKTKK